MTDSAPQTDAARRAAARKAKILARGNTGLAKLAQTARGEEAESLYGDSTSSKPVSSAPSPAPGTPTQSSSPWSPPPPTTSNRPQSQTADQQALNAQLEAMMSMFGGPPGSAGGASGQNGEGMPDMRQMMASLMGGLGGGPGMGATPTDRLLGDMDDPAGLGGAGGLPPDFNPFAGLGMGDAGGGGGFPSFPGMNMPGMGMGMGAQPKSKTEKFFPLVHLFSVLTLLAFVVGWWEPSLKAARWGLVTGSGITGGSGSGWASRWAQLDGGRGIWAGMKGGLGIGSLEVVPIFWAFATLELILQTTRFMILKSPPPPHSLLSTFLPLLPPKISVPLLTGSRYITLLMQMYKDGCLLVFGVGLAVVLATWLKGSV